MGLLLSLLVVSCIQPVLPPLEPPLGVLIIPGRDFIYAVGGDGSQSWVASTQVLKAPVNTDGTVGEWEPDTPLPSPLYGCTGFFLGGWIHVFGGTDGENLSKVEYFAPVDSQGNIGFANTINDVTTRKWEKGLRSLPKGRMGGKIIQRGTYLEWAGGQWDLEAPAARWFTRQWKDGQVGQWYQFTPPVFPDTPLAETAAPLPRIFPSSGFIPAGTPILADLQPGDRLYYTSAVGMEPESPTETSTPFDITNPPKPVEGEIFLWRTFRSDRTPSPLVRSAYQVRKSGMFVLLQGTLTPGSDLSPLKTYELKEFYSNGSFTEVNLVRYQIILSQETTLEIQWSDLNEGPDPRPDTAPVRISVFEEDLQLPAWDAEGHEIVGFTGGFHTPLKVQWPQGKYYFFIERTDGQTGGSFSLRVHTP